MNPITNITELNKRYYRIENLINYQNINIINEIRTYLKNMIDLKKIIRLISKTVLHI